VKKLLFIAALSVASIGPASGAERPAHEEASAARPSLVGCDRLGDGERIETLAHRVLAIEWESGVIDDAQREGLIARLDATLLAACDNIRNRGGEELDAPGVFTVIGDTLKARGYRFMALVQHLSDVLNQPASLWMRADCDTQSLIYVAMGELLELPIYMVEVPGHNFIRFDDGTHRLNWDANTRESIDDEDYASTWGVTDATRAYYLRSMSADEVLAYWRTISTQRLNREISALDATLATTDGDETVAARRDDLAAKRRALLARGVAQYASGRTLNALAWDLLTTSARATRDPQRALELAKRAVEVAPVADWLDTLAVAYAALGDFESAVVEQQKAIAAARAQGRTDLRAFVKRLALFENRETYDP